jgi:two-component system, cell cycle sensor histidine kinase and response regulator CckA
MKRLPTKTISWIGITILAATGVVVWEALSPRRPEDRVYRIGWNPDPPFQALSEDGQPTGLAVELVREAARRRRLRLEWVRQPGGPDGAFRGGNIDLWPVITIIPERKSYIHFTEPYLENEHCFLVRAESTYMEIPDLAGASITHNGVRINERNLRILVPNARILASRGTDEAMEAVCQRSADAVFVEEYTAMSALLSGLACSAQPLRLIPAPDVRPQLAVGSTFRASAAADVIRDEIGKIADQRTLPRGLLRWSYFSRRNLESIQLLAEARRLETRLGLLVVVLLAVLLMAGWLTIRTIRERRKARRAEEELGATQTNYRLLTEQAADGVSLVDRDGRFLLVNSRMCDMLGYTQEEMRCLNVLDTFFPDDRESNRRRLEGISRDTSLRLEHQMRRNDGTAITIEASVVRLGDGRLQQIVRDVTERKRAEGALRESEERFRNMADTAPVMIWVTGPDKLFTFVNKTWLDFTGRSLEQELGNGWAEGVHPDDLERCYKIFCSAFDGRRNFQLECRLRRADGEYRSILCSGVPRFSPGGELAGYIGSDIDITDLQSEERFRQLAENIDQIFWMFDLGTERLIYISPAFEKVLGRSTASAYQDREWLVETVHPEDRDRFRTFLAKMRTEPVEELYRIVRPDGSVRWIHDRAFHVHDPEGKPYRVAGIAEDVTAQRELEEQLRQSQKMEAIGKLAGGIAHDFNNLLTIIGGYSQMLLEGARADDPSRERLEQILGATNRASILTRQLLAFSRRQVLQPKLVKVNHLLANMEILLRRIMGEHITIETALDSDVGCIKIDPPQLDQVVMNLAANARDAMPNGGQFRIETSIVHGPDMQDEGTPCGTEDCVRVRISDTGCGMDHRTRERAFEPFFTTKGVGKGTGLGLSMVYGIVLQNQGTIRIISEPGRGTTFDICFPAAPGSETERGRLPSQRRDREATATILVAEDEPAVRGLVRQTLEQLGYTVLEATDGYEALRVIEQHQHELHLLVTDVVMPLMNGHELASRLKSIRPGTKVLYMSGYTDDVLAFHGIAQREIEFIQKPFTPSGLAGKVEMVLSGRRAAGE